MTKSMTREEAQRRLREAADLLEAVPADAMVSLTSGTLLKALRGLFPCVCGGREPVWDGIGVVGAVAGNAAYLDTGSIKIRGENLKEGDLLEVFAFVPA